MISKNFFASAIFAILFAVNFTAANNIQVSSAALTGQNIASNYTMVQFSLSWENSWRDNINWDAAWVFVKYRASYDTTWKHAQLNTVQGNHIAPGGYTVFPSADNMGAFIYRSTAGNGNVSLANVQLRWDYNLNGLNDADQVEVKVFAIEMVYVPTGPFYAGDGGTLTVDQQFSQGNSTLPFFITSENALTLGGAPLTNLGNRNAVGSGGTADDFNFVTTQTLPAAFPKGYSDSYCMKHEITQGQYSDFLNTLTRYQQKNRVSSDITGDAVANFYVMSNSNTLVTRNRITCPSSGNGTSQPIVFSCDRPDRACNFLSWPDGCAYMDWSGLRPFTDLEFEKLSRGPMIPAADEFAWGNTTITCALALSGTENGTETVTTPNANCTCNNPSLSGGDGSFGPLRAGIFATSISTRTLSGATYYGIMNMSDNLQERIVSVGNTQGRSFNGLHGDGNLTTLGNANVANWPGLVSGEITNSIGSGTRGGCFALNAGTSYYLFAVSGRQASSFSVSSRQNYLGFRGIRSAPAGTQMQKQGKF